MLFNSYIFILLFLPLCLIGYFGLNRFHRYSLAMAFLLGMSLWFYGYFNPSYLAIIVTSILLNYGITRLMRMTDRQGARKAELAAAKVMSLTILLTPISQRQEQVPSMLSTSTPSSFVSSNDSILMVQVVNRQKKLYRNCIRPLLLFPRRISEQLFLYCMTFSVEICAQKPEKPFRTISMNIS